MRNKIKLIDRLMKSPKESDYNFLWKNYVWTFPLCRRTLNIRVTFFPSNPVSASVRECVYRCLSPTYTEQQHAHWFCWHVLNSFTFTPFCLREINELNKIQICEFSIEIMRNYVENEMDSRNIKIMGIDLRIFQN